MLDTNTVLALWMFRDPALEPMREKLSGGHCRLVSRATMHSRSCAGCSPYRQFGQDHEARRRCWSPTATRSGIALRRGPAAVDLPSCRDRDDQKFLEIAASCSPTPVTRDRDLLRLGRHRLVQGRFAIQRPEEWQRSCTK